MAYLNEVLAKTLLQETYLTAYALRINRRAGKAVYLAAGHPPAVVVPGEGPVAFLARENPFVGMFPGSAYEADTMDVRPGDRFILYTDGLVETRSVEASQRGWTESRERLLPVLERLRGASLDELPEAIVREMGATVADDDVAVLAIEV
jgi:sigma-B regulation protein RsbU (phosphoserine phosphatase)